MYLGFLGFILGFLGFGPKFGAHLEQLCSELPPREGSKHPTMPKLTLGIVYNDTSDV